MFNEDIKKNFDAFGATELAIQTALDRNENLKILAGKCTEIAKKYGETDVAVGVLILQAADLVNHKVTYTLEESVCNDEFKGERTLKDCWIATDGITNTIQVASEFYLQFLAVVNRDTKQILALHSFT